MFHNSTTPVPGMLEEVMDNGTTIRDKSYLNGLGIIEGESRGIYMITKTVMEVYQYYTVFNYIPPIPQK